MIDQETCLGRRLTLCRAGGVCAQVQMVSVERLILFLWPAGTGDVERWEPVGVG
jgi:hypothetical protein